MSDVAMVAAVALVVSAFVAIVWLRQRDAAAIRAEQRDERDNSIVARLRGQVEQCETDVRKMKVEQQAFLANARR